MNDDRLNPKGNQNPASASPDSNSGRVTDLRGSWDEDLPAPPTPLATLPGPPAKPPLSTDLMYKGAAARAIRDHFVKQALAMNVTEVGKGDTSKLKIKPWTLQGEDAWKGITRHK